MESRPLGALIAVACVKRFDARAGNHHTPADELLRGRNLDVADRDKRRMLA